MARQRPSYGHRLRMDRYSIRHKPSTYDLDLPLSEAQTWSILSATCTHIGATPDLTKKHKACDHLA
jgi:Rieske Fe-S protein